MDAASKPSGRHHLVNDTPHEKRQASRNPPQMGRVQALLRCRPLLPVLEADHSCKRVHVLESSNTVVVNDFGDATDGGGARRFTFDRVLSSESTQEETFEEVAPLINHVLDGYHATIFAYGQTGSGKTHTMEGLSYTTASKKIRRKRRQKEIPLPNLDTPAELHGIIPRAIQTIFSRAHDREAEAGSSPPPDTPPEERFSYSLKCSYYQIYNETVSDLLRPQRKANARQPSSAANGARKLDSADKGLRIRWQRDNTFRVENLFLYHCERAEEMREAFFTGVREKVVCSHLLNDASSRSHCVFTIYVECRRSTTLEVVRRSELSLVDLAGSERLSLLTRDPSAAFVKESIDINTSLLALGKVITSLADGHRAGKSHVPYRDSKLTKLLQHALGGNSITVMIACIGRSDRYVEESVSTMLYTTRAGRIENVPHINQDATITRVNELRGEVASLREELRYYRELALDQLAPLSAMAERAAAAPGAASPALETPTMGVKSPEAVDQLATSLIDACAMLQQVIGVNRELRGAYEVALRAKEASERREVELNAENLALRERIEMLESIALNEAFLDGKEDDGEAERTGGARPVANGLKAAMRATSDCPDAGKGRGVHVDCADDGGGLRSHARFGSSAFLLEWEGAGRGRGSRGEASKKTLESVSSDPTRETEVGDKNGGSKKGVSDATGPEGWYFQTERIFANGFNSADPLTVRDNEKRASTLESSNSLTAMTSPDGGEEKPRKELFDRSLYTHTDENRLDSDPNVSDIAKKRKKRLKRVLVRKLAEYESRYRLGPYVEPYGGGLRTSSSGGLSSSTRPPRGRPRPPRTPSSDAHEHDALLRNVPLEMRNAVIPKSLRGASSYGELDFGREAEDVARFEEKRREYKAQLAELLARRKELRSSLHQDIYGRSSVPEEEKIPNEAKGMDSGSHADVFFNKEAAIQASSVGMSSASVDGEGSGRKIHLKGRHRADASQFLPYEPAGITCPPLKSSKKRSQHSAGGLERLLKYLASDKVL
ncbi:unnamed protein product [Phytomonas sp. EM1]|nr:unnamed protein product [Phytomonas sp. EM1]|eukprot:CCW60596.1 unnamed protein product [Phytomonas sp. isolate EM1]